MVWMHLRKTIDFALVRRIKWLQVEGKGGAIQDLDGAVRTWHFFVGSN